MCQHAEGKLYLCQDIRHCLVEHYQEKHLKAVRLQLSCIPFFYLYYMNFLKHCQVAPQLLYDKAEAS